MQQRARGGQPLDRATDNRSGDAELVAFRVGHDNVVSSELLQRRRTGSAESGDLGHDMGPALLGCAVPGHSKIKMEPVLGSLRLGNLQQAQARCDARRVMQPRPVHPVVELVVELREPLLARGERFRRRFVDVPGSGLPECSHQWRVRAVQREIDTGQHLPNIGRGDDNAPSAAGEYPLPGSASVGWRGSCGKCRPCGPLTGAVGGDLGVQVKQYTAVVKCRSPRQRLGWR